MGLLPGRLFLLTSMALLIMNADRIATHGACTPYNFVFHKPAYARLPDGSEIFDHAHPVFCPIAQIEFFQPEAGIQRTIETIFCTREFFPTHPDAADRAVV